jgi:rubrerythrin
MKITKTQLKQIIQEELEKVTEMDMDDEDSRRSYTDEEAEERAEYIEVYKMILGMMDELKLDDATKERVDQALDNLLGYAGIYLP